MKVTKTMFSALVAMVLASGNLWSLDLSSFKWDGSLDLNSLKTSNETDANNTADDARARTAVRVTLGVTGSLADDISVRLEGTRVPLPTGAAPGQFGLGATTAHGETTLFTIESAYLDVAELAWGVGARVGRQPWDAGLVGHAGKYDIDSLMHNGVDAISLSRKFGTLDTTLFMGKTVESVANGAVDGGVGDQNVNAVTVSGDLKDFVGTLPSVPVSVGYFQAMDQNTASAADNDNRTILEVKAGLGLLDNALSLGIDWASNGGQLRTAGTTKLDYKGSLMALNAGYSHADSGFGVSWDYALASGDDNVEAASGDDKSWRDLTSFGLTPARSFGEILGRGNVGPGGGLTLGLDQGAQSGGLKLMALGVNYTPEMWDKKVKLNADYVTAESDKQATALTTSKKIGTEMDLSGTWMKSDNLWITLGYATFSPEKNSTVLANGNMNDAVARLFARAGLRF